MIDVTVCRSAGGERDGPATMHDSARGQRARGFDRTGDGYVGRVGLRDWQLQPKRYPSPYDHNSLNPASARQRRRRHGFRREVKDRSWTCMEGWSWSAGVSEYGIIRTRHRATCFTCPRAAPRPRRTRNQERSGHAGTHCAPSSAGSKTRHELIDRESWGRVRTVAARQPMHMSRR